MSTIFWLTDEDSDVDGYRRLKLGGRSDNASLVRLDVSTIDGPGTVEFDAWITDPLDGTDLSAASWGLHVWAKESSVLANAGLRLQVWRYTVDGGEVSAVLDDSVGAEVSTLFRSSGRTTLPATATSLADGDRLVARVMVTDIGTLAAGYTVSMSFNGMRPRVEGDSYIICPDDVSLTAQIPGTTRTKIRRLLMDSAPTNPNLSNADIDQHWDAALLEYTQEHPRVEVQSYDGDGRSVEYRLPRRWIAGFSSIVEVEYPYSADSFPRNLLEMDDWELIEASLGPQPTRALRFVQGIPGSGTGNVRVRYTTRHIHTDEEDTIPAEHLDAVCALAASYACTALAAQAAATSDPTVAADAVQHRDAAQIWQSLAKDYRSRYSGRFRDEAADLTAASVTRDWDITPTIPGEFLFHRSRWR